MSLFGWPRMISRVASCPASRRVPELMSASRTDVQLPRYLRVKPVGIETSNMRSSTLRCRRSAEGPAAVGATTSSRSFDKDEDVLGVEAFATHHLPVERRIRRRRHVPEPGGRRHQGGLPTVACPSRSGPCTRRPTPRKPERSPRPSQPRPRSPRLGQWVVPGAHGPEQMQGATLVDGQPGGRAARAGGPRNAQGAFVKR